MYRVEVELNKLYLSNKNPLSNSGFLEYEVIKKNKTTCWVRLWENGKPTQIIYKNVRYSDLKEK